MTTTYCAVIATRRSDPGGWIVSLVSTEALARVTGWRMLDDIPFVLRCRVKRVWLTRPEVFEVVRAWGVRDAEGGQADLVRARRSCRRRSGSCTSTRSPQPKPARIRSGKPA